MFISENIFFIAEIGINHNGDLNLAKKIIVEAKKAEVNIEYQTYSIGLSNIRVKYNASGALIKITRMDVMISIGVP